MLDRAQTALWAILPDGLTGTTLTRAKFLVVTSVVGAASAVIWLGIDPALLLNPDRLVLWIFAFASVLSAPLALRSTRSLMAGWVLQIAAVYTPIVTLIALASPDVHRWAFWMLLMPVLGAIVAGARGLHSAASLSMLSFLSILALSWVGYLEPVGEVYSIGGPLITLAGIWVIMAFQVRLNETDEASIVSVRADAEVAHEAAVHADRLATLGLLASGVAHGVNNPLLSVMHNVEALELEFSLPTSRLSRPQVRTLISELSTGVQQVQTAVEALGTFSRARSIDDQTTDLELVLHRVVHLVRQAADPRIRVDMRVSGLGHVPGATAEVGQVFLNLLVNAIQAIPKDGLEHRIELVGAPIGDGWIAIEVRDDGEGIPQELVPRVWEPYFTTRDVGEGVGLGLFVVGNAIRRMGGAAELRSRVGLGTTVRLLLPQVHAIRTTPPPPEPVPDRNHRQAARILVVDDESLPLRVVCRALEDHYDVLTEDRAESAYERLVAGERVDLVISDIMMPSITGDQLYRDVVAVRPELAGRFVFITGALLRPGQEEWLREVRVPVLRKPFGIEELRGFVARKLAEPAAAQPTPG